MKRMQLKARCAMVEPIQGSSSPQEVAIVPRPGKVAQIPSHGFAVEDTVTLHNNNQDEGCGKTEGA